MSEQVRRALRLSQMADMARNGLTLTPHMCADKFAVCKRTAQRDLMDLQELIPMVVDEKPRGWEWRMFRKEEL